MDGPRAWVIRPAEMPEYECYDPPRKVAPLIDGDLCGAEGISAGFYKLMPGDSSKNDIHDVEEMYYVVSGNGRLTIGDETFLVEPGMVAYIPARQWHQSTNIGDDELCYLWVFAPPTAGPPIYAEEGWTRHDPMEG